MPVLQLTRFLIFMLFCICIAAQTNEKRFETKFVLSSQIQSHMDLKTKIAEIMNRLFDLQASLQVNNITIQDLPH